MCVSGGQSLLQYLVAVNWAALAVRRACPCCLDCMIVLSLGEGFVVRMVHGSLATTWPARHRGLLQAVW